MSDLPAVISPDLAIFTVTTAARLAGMHPQTLRQYDRQGLVVPKRSRGRGRRYSLNDISKLRLIQHLSQEEGVNLQGIRRILELEHELEQMRAQVAELNQVIAQLHIEMRHQGPRVFTANEHGLVNRGVQVRRMRALPPGG